MSGTILMRWFNIHYKKDKKIKNRTEPSKILSHIHDNSFIMEFFWSSKRVLHDFSCMRRIIEKNEKKQIILILFLYSKNTYSYEYDITRV